MAATVGDPFAAVRTRMADSIRLLVGGGEAAPERSTPASPGLFAPDSVTWVVHGDPAMFVGGLRALLLQTLHPLAMAGVADHSDYRSDPWGRLRRTGRFIGVTTYGTEEEARAMIDRVRRIHGRVHGTAPDGRRYEANDPHLLAWVHVTEVDSFLAAYQRYGRGEPLTADEMDRYLSEMAVVAKLLGAAPVPESRDELRQWLEQIRPELVVGHQARDAVRFLLAPPVALAARPVYGVIGAAAIALLPPWARRKLWLPVAPMVDPLLVRPAARALLAGLDWALAPGRPTEQPAA
ncbi:MAG: oxygenase MpaB family protein [Acidimicrobiales bacterium]|nr:oxygenase MpaB family protein [Acidimicrobiales bacterium]